MVLPASLASPRWEDPYWDERAIEDRIEVIVQKKLPDTIYSRNGLSAADKMDRQLQFALKDSSGKEKYKEDPFEVKIPLDLPGLPLTYAPFSAACAQRLGKRSRQEDEFLLPVEIRFSCKGGEKKGLLFGVFDGHGDDGKAGGLFRDTLPATLSEILQGSCVNVGAVSEEIIGNAFCQAFHEVSRDYQKNHGFGLARFSGATANCAFILEDVVYCPNAGDSRMILITPTHSHQVSEDARLGDSLKEKNVRFTKWHENKGRKIIDMKEVGLGSGLRISVGFLPNMGRELGMSWGCAACVTARKLADFLSERDLMENFVLSRAKGSCSACPTG
jgi:hypothetical protein